VRHEYLKCPREQRIDFLRNLQRRLQTLIREELSVGAQDTRSGPFNPRDRDTLDMADVRLGDPMVSGSHAMLTGSFTPHGS